MGATWRSCRGQPTWCQGDLNGTADVFVHDRQTAQTTMVSVASDGTKANDQSETPAISGNGRYVAFWSLATNLHGGTTEWGWRLFVRDLSMLQTSWVSEADGGLHLSISSDGQLVAFTYGANGLDPDDWNHIEDVYVLDWSAGQATRVSLTGDTPVVGGGSGSGWPSISGDGRFVAFVSDASNLVSGDSNEIDDVFVYDRQGGLTSRVSVATNGAQANQSSQYYPSMSASGRFVAFWSEATSLVPGDTNNAPDVFVRDRDTDGDWIFDEPGAVKTERVSVASDGAQGNGGSQGAGVGPAISADGRFVAFESNASDLVPGDNNGATSDIFVRDRGSSPALPPPAPTGISASDGTYSDKVRVLWNASSGATSYEVWRHTSNDSASATRIAASVGGTSYDDTSASYDTTCYYWVKAKNAHGTSGFSSSDPGHRARPLTACVDDSNATGNEDGTAANPFNTIKEAVNAAADGATIKVAGGGYYENLTIAGKRLTILGGHVGGTYPGGGDFSDGNRDPATYHTMLDGQMPGTQIVCQDAAASS